MGVISETTRQDRICDNSLARTMERYREVSINERERPRREDSGSPIEPSAVRSGPAKSPWKKAFRREIGHVRGRPRLLILALKIGCRMVLILSLCSVLRCLVFLDGFVMK